MTAGCTAESGTCARCRSACDNKPGWFLPGEAEKAADLLGMSLADLFRNRLVVDYWVADDAKLDETVFVLSPRMGEVETGSLVGLKNTGTCTFYVEGRCEIHEAKPFECHQWYCEKDMDELVPHFAVAGLWASQQDQIEELYGSKPELPMPTIGDMIDFLLGTLDRMTGMSSD